MPRNKSPPTYSLLNMFLWRTLTHTPNKGVWSHEVKMRRQGPTRESIPSLDSRTGCGGRSARRTYLWCQVSDKRQGRAQSGAVGYGVLLEVARETTTEEMTLKWRKQMRASGQKDQEAKGPDARSPETVIKDQCRSPRVWSTVSTWGGRAFA